MSAVFSEFANDRLQRAWTEGMEKGLAQGMEKGLEKGVVKGQEKKAVDLILSLIREYHGEPSESQIAMVREVSTEELDRAIVKGIIQAAKTKEELQAWLQEALKRSRKKKENDGHANGVHAGASSENQKTRKARKAQKTQKGE